VPIPKSVARFNKHVTNRLTGRVAGWLPGFAIVIHVGRKSGNEYRTPVNVFRDGDRYVFALTYGRDTDWVRNVTAAGRCRIETRGKTLSLDAPVLFRDPSRRLIPVPARWILGVLQVADFLAMTPEPAAGGELGASGQGQ
jgi:deazaflavin-dependent oxidoreductase (nitroreductase family)